MSLVNQMLQDLEQRRTAEAGASPLGGLSASGAAVSSAQSINYLLLAMTVVSAVVVMLVLIYVFGVKQFVLTEKPMPVEASPNVPVASISVNEETVNRQDVINKKIAEAKQDLVENESTAKREPGKKAAVLSLVSAEKPVSKKVMPVVTEAEQVEQKAASISIREAVSESGSIQKSISEPVVSVPSDAGLVKADSASVPDNNLANRAVSKTIRPLTIEQQAKMAFQDAVKFLSRGNEFAAQEKLEKALSIEPVHLRARETLSALLLNAGRVSEAKETLSEGLRLRPKSTSLAKLYARVLVDQGDSEAALSVLERARPSVSSDTEYYALMAVLYRGVGKHAQASQVYQQILQVRPGVAVWWMGLALAEDAMGASMKALEAYQRALRAGGLKMEVLKYVRSRVAALTPSAAEKTSEIVMDDVDGFED